MEYIHKESGRISHGTYLEYLATIRDRLPEHIHAFASNAEHFNLTSHSSLHDAWLETASIREVGSGENKRIRELEISLCFLGPFHDRNIHLHYTGVSHYSFSSVKDGSLQRHNNIAHGDVFTHEVRLGKEGRVIHEILFEPGATFLVECTDFKHWEEIFAVPG